ncbi:hypothetical protein [Sorangium sp. So ce1097]|uniref:hypothetical protein n=1 Tax=Sorangium sp. So ce1097 TaxID=3133330 RepID=UPI003F62C2F3
MRQVDRRYDGARACAGVRRPGRRLGDSTFTAGDTVSTDLFSKAVALVDVNGNGKLDLIVGSIIGPGVGGVIVR